mmetsp:Transcript_18909/g.42525  ORF Transcript_18909/g.42525 Transcript_18909/m.42525 type:complete len:308 (+) Transcript_18909:1796-2719(+)
MSKRTSIFMPGPNASDSFVIRFRETTSFLNRIRRSMLKGSSEMRLSEIRSSSSSPRTVTFSSIFSILLFESWRMVILRGNGAKGHSRKPSAERSRCPEAREALTRATKASIFLMPLSATTSGGDRLGSSSIMTTLRATILDIHGGSASSSEKVRFSETHSSPSFFSRVNTSGTRRKLLKPTESFSRLRKLPTDSGNDLNSLCERYSVFILLKAERAPEMMESLLLLSARDVSAVRSKNSMGRSSRLLKLRPRCVRFVMFPIDLCSHSSLFLSSSRLVRDVIFPNCIGSSSRALLESFSSVMPVKHPM